MAKYKVGDKVRIVRKRPREHWNPEMGKYLGKTMTIIESGIIHGEVYYNMEEDGDDPFRRAEGARVAVERLFEKKRKEEKPKESRPKVGDKFVVTVKGGRFDHGFGIGDIVTLVRIQQDGCFRLADKSGFIQVLHPSEVCPYKEKSK